MNFLQYFRPEEEDRTHAMVEALEEVMTEPTDFVANAKVTFSSILTRLDEEIKSREEAMRKLRFELDGLHRVKQAYQVGTVKLNGPGERWEDMQP